MEELLIFVLQAIGQIIFELFAYWPFEIFWPSRSLDPDGEGPFTLIWWWGLVLLTGCLLGVLSLYFFPDVLLKLGWLRIALLVISPLGSAVFAKRLAEFRVKKDDLETPMAHFWFALLFSIGFVWVRFAFAHRPG